MSNEEIELESGKRDLSTRRELLYRLAGGSAVTVIASQVATLSAIASTSTRLHVIVIGAGIAGLCAAFELEQAGHKVTILEAETKHVGGRIRTVRGTSGQYGELGAMRIPANHHLTRHYIQKFSLQTRKFVQYDPAAYYFVHNSKSRNRDVQNFDHRITNGMDGRSQLGSEWANAFDEIVGGMDLLPQAIVAKLKSKPDHGCRVTMLEQDNLYKKVAVTYTKRVDGSRTSASNYRLEADMILCTLPAPAVRKLSFEPILSPSKTAALAHIPYLDAHKTLIETRSRFWELKDKIYGGASYTDLKSGQTYYPSDNAIAKNTQVSHGPGMLLASYTIGRPALVLANMSHDRRTNTVISSVGKLHPEILQHGELISMVDWDWGTHPFSLGAFAAPGRRMELGQILARPEGRIYFAGEHLSVHRTWIQGALESALAAVKAMSVVASSHR